MHPNSYSTEQKVITDLIRLIESDDDLDKQAKEAFIKGLKDVGWKALEKLPVVGGLAETMRGVIDFATARHKLTSQLKLFKVFTGINAEVEDINKYINNENIIFLTKKLIQDDENNKSTYYTRLAINILNSVLPNNKRTKLIVLLSNLTTFDIDIARKYYIYSKFEFLSNGNIPLQLKKLSTTNDGYLLSTINFLLSSGLINEVRNNNDSINYYIPTNLLIDLCENIYTEDELEPAAINEERLPNDIVIFITTPLGHDLDEAALLDKLTNDLSFNKFLANPNGEGLIYNTSEIERAKLKCEQHLKYIKELTQSLNHKFLVCNAKQFNSIKRKSNIYVNVHIDDDTELFNSSAFQNNRNLYRHDNSIHIYTEIKKRNLIINKEHDSTVKYDRPLSNIHKLNSSFKGEYIYYHNEISLAEINAILEKAYDPTDLK